MHRRSLFALAAAALSLGLINLPSADPAAAQQAAPVERWSDPSTWGGSLPGEGDVVEIPAGKSVLLDVDPPSLGGLQIDGTLEFAATDLELSSEWIVVHGALRVGSEDDPFLHQATITLTDPDRAADVMGSGGRAISVMGGTLELHGTGRTSWTQLGATAQKDARSITLSKPADWHTGDRIVIASTDYWSHHAEERTISAVEGNTVHFDRPLEYSHFGRLQRFGGRVVDERAEVGLLSRNVLVRGASDSTEDGYGGQIMVMSGGEARLEDVELTRMGQRERLRRYPVHFHMLGAAPNSYVRNSSIHHTFNRCLTIHGTDQLRVLDNVCYDHIGHGFFLEDGAETDNVLEHNLGLVTRSSDEPLLPSDERPATFWITNPDNVVTGNVAAGSEGIGFWYALPERPTGLSSGSELRPTMTPLGKFSGNVSHSNGGMGLHVDDGPRPDGTTESTYYAPRSVPGDWESEPVTAKFQDFTAYKNRDRGVWLRGEHQLVTDSVMADNRSGATFAASEVLLTRSLVVGETANRGNPESWEDSGRGGRELPFFWEPKTAIKGFEFYDGRVGVKRTTFVNFKSNSLRRAGALGYLERNAFSIHPGNHARSVRFRNATPVFLTDPARSRDGDAAAVFVDADGSVTGRRGRSVVVDNPFLLTRSCRFKRSWNAHICGERYVRLMLGTLDDDPNDIKPLVLTRSDGRKQRLAGCCDDSTTADTSILPRRDYSVRFNQDPGNGFRFVLIDAPKDWAVLRVKVAPGFEVTRWGYPVDEAASQRALRRNPGSAYFYDRADRVLHVKVHGDGSHY
ncbi:MAG: G8 domain-containing protein, partial [Actinomycetota bacterium]